MLARSVAAAALLAGSVLGCGPMAVGGYRVHSATLRPSSLENYPHVTFEDREAYLLGNDWYYVDARYGLVVFDDEPPELRAHREHASANTPASTK